MSIKMILTDLDGTLLSKGQVAISNQNMAALKQAAEKGIHVIPCTGRVVDMLPPQLLTCDFVRYIVSSHGARVYDCMTGETLYEKTLSPEESHQILKIIEGKGIYAEVAAAGTIYVEKTLADQLMDYPIPYHHYWYMRDRRFTAVENIADYFLENQLRIEKINIYSMPEALWQEIYEALEALGTIRFTKEGAAADLEFYHRSLDKVEAVNALLARLGTDVSEVFAIGDSMTDYPVLRIVGESVAMGNAINSVKAVAKHLTDANTEDGVGKAIQKYVLDQKETKNTLCPLDRFQGKHEYLVCIDSDGCAMDTMEIKHKECFCTAFIEVFGLQGIAKYAREAWDYTNLYSKTRGFYRMKTLLLSMELLEKRREVIERGFKLPDMAPLKKWCESVSVLSDATLEEYAKAHPAPILDTVLEWSAEVNRRVKRLVHNVPPFPYVRESLANLQGKADVVVVSATPTAALEKEWSEHGLKAYTSFICGQEYGAKKEIISALKAQYGDGNVLMIGDAIGDQKAASSAGAFFYPICPNGEDHSWKVFHDSVSETFLKGGYNKCVQKVYAEQLDACLLDVPAWDSLS